MTDPSIKISIPLDSDGFMRRECPSCEREFKWLPTAEGGESPAAYRCPYCREVGAPDQWWTKQQAEHIAETVQAQVVRPQLDKMAKDFNRRSPKGGLISAKMTVKPARRSTASLAELDDMVRVDFSCHPEEPLKVLESWKSPVGCLLCSSASLE